MGTPAWFAWLESATAFAFTGPSGRFTARKEARSQGGVHWKAYHTSHGTLHRAYLGKTPDLTLDRLNNTAATLATASPPPYHLTASASLKPRHHRANQPAGHQTQWPASGALLVGLRHASWLAGLRHLPTPVAEHSHTASGRRRASVDHLRAENTPSGVECTRPGRCPWAYFIWQRRRSWVSPLRCAGTCSRQAWTCWGSDH